MNRRFLPVLTAATLGLGATATAAPAASASTSSAGRVARASAHVAELGHAFAGRPATFALKTAHASAYSLSFGDHSRTLTGKHGPATRVSHTFGKAGWYTVTLKVTAAHQKPVTSSQRVLVLSPAGASAAPVAVASTPAAGIQPRTSGATVTGFSPNSGLLHAPVTITGTGFTSPASATFGGVVSSATVVNSTTITTSVPLGAGSGPLIVTTNGGPVTVGTFTVNAGILPTLSVGQPTSSTTIYGAGYAADEGLAFSVGGTPAGSGLTTANGSFTAAVTIPASAQPGATLLAVTGSHSGLVTGTTFTVRTDWAQRAFGTDHKGVNSYENTLSPGTVSGLGRAFSVATSGPVYDSPAVVGGIAYFGSEDETFRAVNATTGAPVWSVNAGGLDYSSPAVANGIVYFGLNNKSVYALNAATGAQIWTYLTGGAIISSPAVVNGVVYVGSDDDKVYALNASTGAVAWSYATGSSVESSPAVANGMVYVGSDDDKVYALSASSGTLAWSFTTGGEVFSSPAVVNGVVYVGSADDKVYALNASTGAVAWSYTTTAPVYSSPSVTNGVVYIGSDDAKLYALNASSGTLDWSFATGDYVISTPAVANGVVYVTSEDDSIYALDLYGDQLWKYATGSLVTSSPVVVNGTLYAGSFDESFYGFSLTGGANPSA